MTCRIMQEQTEGVNELGIEFRTCCKPETRMGVKLSCCRPLSGLAHLYLSDSCKSRTIENRINARADSNRDCWTQNAECELLHDELACLQHKCLYMRRGYMSNHFRGWHRGVQSHRHCLREQPEIVCLESYGLLREFCSSASFFTRCGFAPAL